MPLFYPPRVFGRFGLGLGLTSTLLHERFGLDFGERFHRDAVHRVESLMEADRQVWDEFRELGIGYAEPFPRATIEPFGHRFVPVMYGSRCVYSPSEEPAVLPRAQQAEEIASLAPWTPERFEAAEPVRVVGEQLAALRARYGDLGPYAARMGYNPHYQPLSSLQNLGSVINSAVSIFGEGVLVLYEDDPALLRALYRNISDLMLLCLDRFPRLDGRPLTHVFVGDCTVAMISPRQYESCNLPFDRELARFASSIGAGFLVHQDSGTTPHLRSYARLAPVAALDVGQDTDFAEVARIFPAASVSCILFPSWIAATPAAELEAELEGIMRLGLAMPRFDFSIFEVDPSLARGKIQQFHEIFRRSAERVSREGAR
jgi:hypothetical protein